VSVQSASPGFVHRQRRGAELVLLVLALAVGVGAYAAVGLGVKYELPADMIGYSIWLAALALAAHVVVRWVAPWSDPVLLPVVTALNGLGLAMIYRIDLASDTNLSAKQLMWTTLGVVLFAGVLIVLRDHRRLQAFTYTIGLLSIFLLLLPMIPGLGKEINGARIWPRSAWSSPSPATSCSTATRWRWPAVASPASTCPAVATWGRSWPCGW
jgi:hypothetical protein